MTKVTDGLEQWRTSRNMQDMKFEFNVQVANILEEVTEYLRAKDDHERVDALCDISVFVINNLVMLGCKRPTIYNSYFNYSYNLLDIPELCSLLQDKDVKSRIEYLNEMITVCLLSITNLGYDYEKCMLETIKEISSREQDPSQADLWYNQGISGKWEKNRMQDPKTLYKADYSSCVIKK